MAEIEAIEEIQKFNPYHGSDGRFSTANGAHSFTYSPGKSKAHDLAIEREKQRQAATGGSGGKYTKEEQIKAIEDWSDGAYGKIRRVQQGKYNGSDAQKYKDQGEALEEFINSQPSFKGDLYRGISTDEEIDFKKGQKITMNGTSSWSKDDDIADEFSRFDEYSYMFVTSNLNKAADISKYAMNPGEQEVLVSKNVTFEVEAKI